LLNGSEKRFRRVPCTAVPYPKVDPQPSFPEIETSISAFWEADRTFEASVAQRHAGINGDNEFIFYDGPPFANGLPHY
jgi:isoleucyl-tRNA synthetase